MIKHLLTAALTILTACSCSSAGHSSDNWLQANSFPPGVIKVDEAAVVNNPFGDDHGRHYRCTYTLDRNGRLISRERVSSRGTELDDYHYTGGALTPDSVTVKYADGDHRTFVYDRKEPCKWSVVIDYDNYPVIDYVYTDSAPDDLPDGMTMQIERNKSGDLISRSIISGGQVSTSEEILRDDKGNPTRYTATYGTDTTVTAYEYDYSEDGYWTECRMFKVYPDGARDLRLTITRTLYYE